MITKYRRTTKLSGDPRGFAAHEDLVYIYRHGWRPLFDTNTPPERPVVIGWIDPYRAHVCLRADEAFKLQLKREATRRYSEWSRA